METSSKWTSKDIAKIGIVMALYVILTVAIAPLSYGNIQFRFSEILLLLCFFNPKYNWSLILGCLIANLFSPLGVIDIAFGTIATILTVFCINKCKNIWIASLFASIWNSLIVGFELSYVYNLPYWIPFLEVFAGEFVVVTLIGCPLFILLNKNNSIDKFIK